MKKQLFSMLSFLMLCIGVTAQTTLISPTGDGGFETGGTFAANNWSITSATQVNQWVVGVNATPGFTGVNAAYVSDTYATTTTHSYVVTSASVVHFYRNITVPAGETNIQLAFKWLCQGEGTAFDRMRIWLVPTGFTPTAGTAITSTGSAPAGRVQVGLTNYNLQGTWTTANVVIPAAYAGNSFRIVFEWRNDGSGGTMPPAAIDDISMTSSSCGLTPTALNTSTILSSSANFTWTPGGTEASWDIYYGTSPLTPPTASTVPTASSAVVSYSATGLMNYTGYSVYVRANCGGGIYSPWTAVKAFTTACIAPNVTSTTSGSICGVGNATLGATGDPGATLNWYTVPTGGSVVATGSVYITPTISNTTIYYVTAGPLGCESVRAPVTASVVVPDAVTASASATNLCVGGVNSVNLTAAQTGTNGNVYSFTWNASPTVGSGMPTPVTGASTSVSLTSVGNYAYMVTATDGTCTAVSTVNVVLNNLPTIIASANPTVVCSGVNVNLTANTISAGFSTLGTGTLVTTNSGTSSGNNVSPFSHWYGGYKAQYIILASELQAAGITAGNITSLGFNVTTAGTNYASYAISMAATAATAATTTFDGSVSQVYTAASVTPTVGLNTYNFGTPFNWNGTSNIVVQICWSNNNGGGAAAEVKYTSTPFVSMAYYRADNTAPATLCGNGTAAGTISNRPFITLGGQSSSAGGSSHTWQWNPGAINSNTAAVNPINSGSVAATQIYTVSITNTVTTCSNTGTVSVLVNPLPSAPIASNSSQCGVGVSTASVSGGTSYNWYATPTSTTVLQSGTSSNYTTAIGSTTTWYVTSAVGACESSTRAAVTTTVSTPDAVTANTSNSKLCVGGANTVTLTAVQTGTNGNVYTFTWNASPVSGSGMPTPVNGTVTSVTPTLPGLYNYSVTATDGICTTISSVSVALNNLPAITAMITPTDICSGSTVTLNGQSINSTSGLVTVGTGTVASITGGPYRQGAGTDNKTQYLFTAAELTAAGLTTGNITDLRFNVTANGAGLMNNFTIKMGNTSLTTLGTTYAAAPPVVMAPTSYSTVLGTNNHAFDTPFYWDGVSNVIIEVCHDVVTGGSSSTISQQTISNRNIYSNTAGACALAAGTSNTIRALISLAGELGTNVSSSMTFTWNPGAITTNTAIVTPINTGSVAVNQTYTVTVNDPATTCSNSTTADVLVYAIPTTPVATDATQCGLGIPTASVSGGTSYNWYATPTSTVLVQTGSSANYTTAISSTTTWYIASTNGNCESPRVALTQTVNTPPVLTLNAPSICQSSSSAVSLSVTSTVGSYDTYVWSPVTNLFTDPAGTIPYSGQNTSLVYVKSITPGTLTYTANATNSVTGCGNVANTTVQVDAVPSSPTSTMTNISICQGASTASINATASGTLMSSFGSNLISTGVGAATFIINVPALPAGASIISTKLKITNAQATNGSWMSEMRVALSGATTLAPTQISTTNNPGTVAPNPVITIPNLPLAGGSVTLSLTESFDDGGVDDALYGNVEIEIVYNMPPSSITWWNAASAGTQQGTGSPFETIGTVLLPTSSTAGTYTFFAQTNAGTCASTTRLPISVIINPVLVALSPVDVTCNGGNNGTFTLGAVTCGLAPFTYGVNGGAFAAIPTNLTAGSYTVIVKDANGDNSAPMVLTINQPSWTIPNATGTNTLVCTGAPSATIGAISNLTGLVLTQTITLGTAVSLPGSGQVVLTSPVSLPAGAIVNSTSVIFQDVTTTALTYPSDIDVDISGAITLAPTILANVNAVVTNAGPYTIVTPNVTNGTINLTLTNNWSGAATIGTVSVVYSYTQPATINWYTASTGGTLIATSNTLEAVGTSVLPNTATPGVYNFFAEATYGACTSAARTLVTVTVNPTPTVTAIASNTVICSGTPVTFTASGATNYTWSPAGGSSATPTVSPSSNTTYTVTGTSLGCSSTATLAMVVNTTPTLTASASTTLICSGSVASTLTASSTIANYSWTPTGGTSAVEVVTPTVSTIYTVTSANGNCVATATLGVNVNTTPTLTLSATTASMCSGSTATLTAAGATNYTWTPTGDLTAVSVVTPSATTIYTLTGETSGCAATSTINLDVTSTPTISAVSSSTSICVGNSATLTAVSSITDYTWAPAGGTGDIAIVSPTATTIYTVTSTNGACVSSTTVSLDVLSTPVLTVSPLNATVCAGSSTTLTVSGADTYTWSGTGGNAATAVYSPTANATYTVDGTTACGTGSATVMISTETALTINAITSSTMLCSGETATLTASGTATSYTWAPGGQTTAIIAVTPTTSTIYTVSSSNACGVVTATVNQNVSPCAGIQELESANINVYPNPSTGIVNFDITSELAGNVSLEMYDAIGKLVVKENLAKEHNTLNISKLEEGIYIFKLIRNNGDVKIGRFVKHN